MKRCPICKKIIADKKHPTRIYCSSECQHQVQKKCIIIRCDICKKVIIRPPSWIRNNNFCSHKCHGIFKIGKPAPNKGKHIINSTSFKKGSKHKNWKGGRCKRRDGYILIYKPKHPFKDNYNYVREHRFVMEQHLGRYLKPSEVVHHINGNTSDNRIDNLMLFPSGKAHTKYHNFLKRKGKSRK